MPNEHYWWKVLRRAFNVPDVVSDQRTVDAVTAGMLVIGHDSNPAAGEVQLDHDQTLAVAEQLVHMGVKGELDVLFIPGADRAAGIEAILAAIDMGGVDALTRACLDKLIAFVDRHPYQDDVGGDLSLPYTPPG